MDWYLKRTISMVQSAGSFCTNSLDVVDREMSIDLYQKAEKKKN